jgi:PPE-repeat protein
MEFWAQDAGAMYSYASNSAAATQLTELPQPAEVTDPTGLVDQAIAVVKGAGQAVQAELNSVGAQLVPRVGDILQTLSSPLNGQSGAIDAWITANTPLDDLVPLYSKYLSPYVNSVAAFVNSTNAVGNENSGFSGLGSLANNLAKSASGAQAAEAAQGAARAAASAANGLGNVAAKLGNALPIGKLSAPASWTISNAPTTAGATALSNATAIPAATEGAAVGNTPVAPPFGQFINGGNGRKTPAYGHRLTFMARPPAAG